jgi:hypothetical protein
MIIHPHKDTIPADTYSAFWTLDNHTIISDDKRIIAEWNDFGFVSGIVTVQNPPSFWHLDGSTEFRSAVRRMLRCTLGRDPWFPVVDVAIFTDNIKFDYHFGSPFYSGLACYIGKPVMRLEPAFQRACRFGDIMNKALNGTMQETNDIDEIYKEFWSHYLPLRMEIADATDTSTLYRGL